MAPFNVYERLDLEVISENEEAAFAFFKDCSDHYIAFHICAYYIYHKYYRNIMAVNYQSVFDVIEVLVSNRKKLMDCPDIQHIFNEAKSKTWVNLGMLPFFDKETNVYNTCKYLLYVWYIIEASYYISYENSFYVWQEAINSGNEVSLTDLKKLRILIIDFMEANDQHLMAWIIKNLK